MLRVASRRASGRGNGPVAELLQDALDEGPWQIRTLARKIAAEQDGKVDSWRAQIYKILGGQQPERATAIRIAKALGKDPMYLVVENGAEPKPLTVRELAAMLRETRERVAELERRIPPPAEADPDSPSAREG